MTTEKNNQTNTDTDVSDARSRGSAILYGLFALVITLIVATGVFYGGRAVYRALNGSSNEDNISKENTSKDQAKNSATENSDQSSESKSDNEQTTGSSNESQSSSSSEDQARPQTFPNTGDSGGSTGTLPHTGDPGH